MSKRAVVRITTAVIEQLLPRGSVIMGVEKESGSSVIRFAIFNDNLPEVPEGTMAPEVQVLIHSMHEVRGFLFDDGREVYDPCDKADLPVRCLPCSIEAVAMRPEKTVQP